MMNFQKTSQKIVIALALLWVVLLLVPSIPLGYRYIYIGALIFYLGIQNIILLNLGLKSGKMPDKLVMYQERLGERAGTIRFGTFAVCYIIFGALVIFSGFNVLNMAA